MKKITQTFSIAVLLAIIFIAQVKAQPFFNWAGSLSGAAYEVPASVYVNSSHEVFTVGQYSGSVDFDPSANDATLTSTTQTMFLSKLDVFGHYLWVKDFSTTSNITPVKMCVDDSGNFVIAGYFSGTADFNPGAGNTNTASASLFMDVFVCKLDSNGLFKWVKRMGNATNDYAYDIAMDANGNIYLTGSFQGTVDFDPNITVLNLTSAGNTDAYVVKLTANGNFAWAKRWGSTTMDNANFIVCDAAGNTFISGTYTNTVDFDPNIGVHNLTTSTTGHGYLLKLNAAGNFSWVNDWSGTGTETLESSAWDLYNHLYISGEFSGVEDFQFGAGTTNLTSAGLTDIFLLKIDTAGNFMNVKKFGAANNDHSYAVTISDTGAIYLTGDFSTTVDFNPGGGIFNLTSSGTSAGDCFILLLDSAENFINALSYGEQFGTETIESIAVDENESVYVTGYFYSSMDIDPGVAVYNLWGQGSADIYVMKLSQCEAHNTELYPYECDSYTAPDGQVYDTSGLYYAYLTTVNGCDSVFTIYLTLHYTSSFTYDTTVCDLFFDPFGVPVFSSGQYQYILNNWQGCDSTLTVNLTMNSTSFSTIPVTSCNAYTAPDGSVHTQSETFSCIIPNSIGCDSSMTIILTIGPITANATVNGSLLHCINNGAQYQWVNCNTGFSAIAGATNQNYTATASGSYAVIVTSGTCIDTSGCKSVTVVGVEDLFAEKELLVFPNPSNGKFTVQLPATDNFNLLQIENTLGQIVFTQQISNEHLLHLSLNDLSAGVYFVHVTGDDYDLRKQLVIVGRE